LQPKIYSTVGVATNDRTINVRFGLKDRRARYALYR